MRLATLRKYSLSAGDYCIFRDKFNNWYHSPFETLRWFISSGHDPNNRAAMLCDFPTFEAAEAALIKHMHKPEASNEN